MTRVDYDAELQKHNEVLRSAYGIERNDRVLDIGCGAGQTTREAARLASSGAALGVDKSAAMIERARRLSANECLHNVIYLQADAETYGFESEGFDVAISRFGTMFFAQPVAAFTNVARALRRGGRMVMLVWERQEDNAWSVLIQLALSAGPPAPATTPAPADAFLLADPIRTERVLVAAGFSEVSFADVRAPVYYGQDVPSAMEWILGFATVSDALTRATPTSAETVLERLRDQLAARAGRDGVWLDARAWLVSASRP